MSKIVQPTPYERHPLGRMYGTAALVLLIAGAVAWRLYDLQVNQHAHYRALHGRQINSIRRVEFPRGSIYDRQGHTLAVSVPVDSIYMSPGVMRAEIWGRALRQVTRNDEASLKKLEAAVNASGRTAEVHACESLIAGDLATQVGSILEIDPDRILQNIQSSSKFRWVKRKCSPEATDAIRALGLKGLGYRQEFERRYPNGEVAANLLGGVGVDENGLEGLERIHDVVLSPSHEEMRVYRDALANQWVREFEGVSPGSRGMDLQLTIDLVIQDIVETELQRAVINHKPKGAVAIAMDPHTGEILALANYPTFDPNALGEASLESRRNRALTDPFEPGSTFKCFIAAAVLQEGIDRGMYDCENGVWNRNGRILHDHHPFASIPLREVIVHSSNIGAAKMGFDLGRERLYSYVQDFGFASPTWVDGLSSTYVIEVDEAFDPERYAWRFLASDIVDPETGAILAKARTRLKKATAEHLRDRKVPHVEFYQMIEDPGQMTPWARFNDYSVASVAFGHEITVTPLQMVSAMSVIANGGEWIQPSIVAGVRRPDGTVQAPRGERMRRRVIREDVSRTMRDVLAGVVEEGTGRKSASKLYRFGGKTGTSQKIINGLYSHEHFIGSFIGIGPVDHPRVVMYFALDDPTGKYYGGTVAAPYLGAAMEKTLQYLEVPSDFPEAEAQLDARAVNYR